MSLSAPLIDGGAGDEGPHPTGPSPASTPRLRTALGRAWRKRRDAMRSRSGDPRKPPARLTPRQVHGVTGTCPMCGAEDPEMPVYANCKANAWYRCRQRDHLFSGPTIP